MPYRDFTSDQILFADFKHRKVSKQKRPGTGGLRSEPPAADDEAGPLLPPRHVLEQQLPLQLRLEHLQRRKASGTLITGRAALLEAGLLD